MELNQTVFLIGFMGAGKTTLGKKIAAKTGLQFIDLDARACWLNGFASVAEWVELKGMEHFRLAEKEALLQVPLNKTIIATGGGTPCYFDNMQWMLANGIIVYISLDEKTLYNRLKATNRDSRPLLMGKSDDELMQYIHHTLRERKKFYEQAHLQFNPLTQSIDWLLEQLQQIQKA